jgi:hypothetical protein
MRIIQLITLALLPLSLAWAEELETVTGEKFTTSLQSISSAGEVNGEGLPRKLNLAELRSYVRQPLKEMPTGKVVIDGHAGSKLHLKTLSFTGDEFVCLSEAGLAFKLPFDGLRGVRFEPATVHAAFEESLAKPSKESDLIFVKVDQQIELVSGLLAGLSETEITIDVSNEKRKVPREKVFGIVLAQSNAAAAVSAIITMEDGSRLAAQRVELKDQTWKAHLVGGAACEISTKQIWRVDFRPPGLIFISELEPLTVKEEPIFTAPLAWKRDRSVGGNVLTLGGQKFEKGLGVHARSEITFAVPADCNAFFATIGIDDETRRESSSRQPAGDCEFIVLGDDRELFTARMKSADAPKPIRVDLRNVKKLTLLVEPGEDFDFADHANWCDARLLKLPK